MGKVWLGEIYIRFGPLHCNLKVNVLIQGVSTCSKYIIFPVLSLWIWTVDCPPGCGALLTDHEVVLNVCYLVRVRHACLPVGQVVSVGFNLSMQECLFGPLEQLK